MPIETSPAPFQDEQTGYSYSGSISMAPPAQLQPIAALQSHTPAAAAANTLIAAEFGGMATPFKAIPALPEAGYTAPVQHAHRFAQTPPMYGRSASHVGVGGYQDAAMGMGMGAGTGVNGGAMSMYGGIGSGLGVDMADAYSTRSGSGVPGPRPSVVSATTYIPFPLSRSLSMPTKQQLTGMPIPSPSYDRRASHLHPQHAHQLYLHRHRHEELELDDDNASDCSYYARRHHRHGGSSVTRPSRHRHRHRDASGRYSSPSPSRSRGQMRHRFDENAIESSESDDDEHCIDCRRTASRHGHDHEKSSRPRRESMISPRQHVHTHIPFRRHEHEHVHGHAQRPDSPPELATSPLQDYMRRLKIQDDTARSKAKSKFQSNSHTKSHKGKVGVDAERGVMSDTEVVRPRSRRATDNSIPVIKVTARSHASGAGKEDKRDEVHQDEVGEEVLYRRLPKDTVDQFKRHRRRSDIHGFRPNLDLLNVPASASILQPLPRSRLGSEVGHRPRRGSFGAKDEYAHTHHGHSHSHTRRRAHSHVYLDDGASHYLEPAEHQYERHRHTRAHSHSHSHYAPSAGSHNAGGAARSWVSPSALSHGNGHANANAPADGFPFPLSSSQADMDMGPSPEVAHLNPMISGNDLGMSGAIAAAPDGRVSQYGLPRYPHQPKVDYRRFMVQRGNADVYLD